MRLKRNPVAYGYMSCNSFYCFNQMKDKIENQIRIDCERAVNLICQFIYTSSFTLGKDEEGRQALRWLRGDIQENILEEKLIRLELQTRTSGRVIQSFFKIPGTNFCVFSSSLHRVNCIQKIMSCF